MEDCKEDQWVIRAGRCRQGRLWHMPHRSGYGGKNSLLCRVRAGHRGSDNTGAKPVSYRGKAIAAGYLAAGRTYEFRYNGTQWELVGDLDTNNTYSNMKGATASAAGAAGLAPAPPAGAQEKYLRGDGTWVEMIEATDADIDSIINGTFK